MSCGGRAGCHRLDGKDRGSRMTRRWACAVGIGCLVSMPLGGAGRAGQEGKSTPDISGFWELNFDGRKVPRANLLPAVTRAKIDAHAKGDAYAIRWCNLLGVPFVMDSGRPLDIRQGAGAVIIVPETPSPVAQGAARVLRDHIRQMSGAELPS